MMSDHELPDLDDDDIRRVFNDLARTELTTAIQPMCECNCTGDTPHADRLCGARAVVLVGLHRWGWCDEPADAGGTKHPENVDAEGNLTAMMCQRCARHAVTVAGLHVRQLAVSGQPMECPTCRKPVERALDIAKVTPL